MGPRLSSRQAEYSEGRSNNCPGVKCSEKARGTGREDDDEHAEWDALEKVRDKSALAGATLYTTLEPCTPPVRSKPLECCTELVLQHQIKRVFVGMLDPNQGVTGKGLLRLQEAGVEVALFPHDLSAAIRAENAAFIRSQQTLCDSRPRTLPGRTRTY
jgi:pyrimidine deaminase RibD-like protein